MANRYFPVPIQKTGLSRIISQYAESPNIQAFVPATLSEAQVLSQEIIRVVNERGVDTAVGVNLDIVGDLVGQLRYTILENVGVYFGFDGVSGTLGYDEGEFWNGVSDGLSYKVTDDEYRTIIKSRIAKNNSRGTREDIINQLLLMFLNMPSVEITDDYPAGFSVSFGRMLEYYERYLILRTDIIPRPAGVSLNDINYLVDGAVFGFDGADGTLGYDEGSYDKAGGVVSIDQVEVEITFIALESGQPAPSIILFGAASVQWLHPNGSTISTGITPSPALTEVGTYRLTVDDWTKVDRVVFDNGVLRTSGLALMSALTRLEFNNGAFGNVLVAAVPTLEWYTDKDHILTSKYDVDFRHNQALTRIIFSGNLSIRQPILGDHPALTIIDIDGCPNVGVLNLADIPLLAKLGADNSGVKQVDISANPLLNDFTMNDNSLNVDEVDKVLDDIFPNRLTAGAGSVAVGGNNATATGVYQEPVDHFNPASPLEKAWVMVNDYSWTVTANGI